MRGKNAFGRDSRGYLDSDQEHYSGCANPFSILGIHYAAGCVANLFPSVRPPQKNVKAGKQVQGQKKAKHVPGSTIGTSGWLRGGFSLSSLPLCPFPLSVGPAVAASRRPCAVSCGSTSSPLPILYSPCSSFMAVG